MKPKTNSKYLTIKESINYQDIIHDMENNLIQGRISIAKDLKIKYNVTYSILKTKHKKDLNNFNALYLDDIINENKNIVNNYKKNSLKLHFLIFPLASFIWASFFSTLMIYELILNNSVTIIDYIKINSSFAFVGYIILSLYYFLDFKKSKKNIKSLKEFKCKTIENQ